MKLAFALAAAAAVTLSAPAAMASEQLATKNGCLGCHKIDGKGYGPSFKEVAKKYKGDAKGAEHIVGVMEKGSVGVWAPGTNKMPPMPKAKDDAKAIAAWILSL